MGEFSSSFEFYEGLRALVPGAFVVGLYAAICKTFGIAGAASVDAPLAALLATLAVGFVVLFLDLPSKAAVFQYSTPIAHVASWKDLQPRASASAKNIYYEILDVEVPAGIKTKVHYFGALYKIGFEFIYITATSIPVLGVIAVFPSTSVVRQGPPNEMRAAFIVALGLHLVVAASAARARWGKISSDLSAELRTFDRLLLSAGLAGLVLYLVYSWRWIGIVAIGVPWGLWAFRYFAGVHIPGQTSARNLHGSTASVLYVVAAASLCMIGVHMAGHANALELPMVTGWMAASMAAAALVAARDHEKKLLGVYATQRTWLDGHRDKLVAKGYFTRV